MSKLIVTDKRVEVRCPATYNEWIVTSIWNHPRVVDEKYANYEEITRFESFEELFAVCAEGGIRNCEAEYCFRKPFVRVNNVTGLCTNYIRPKHFKYFEVRTTYEPAPQWSIDYLRKELPADDFARLCESKGWKIF